MRRHVYFIVFGLFAFNKTELKLIDLYTKQQVALTHFTREGADGVVVGFRRQRWGCKLVVFVEYSRAATGAVVHRRFVRVARG